MGPGAVGAKRTVTEQEVEGASIIVLQPLVTIANTVEPTMLAVTGPVVDCPELLTVKVATWLTVPCSTPRKSNDGTFGVRTPGVSPMPERLAVVMPPAVALTVSVAAFAPIDVGAKRTRIMQLPLPGMAAVQPLPPAGIENCALSAPPMVTLGTELGMSPSFVDLERDGGARTNRHGVEVVRGGRQPQRGICQRRPQELGRRRPPPNSVSESVASFVPGVVGTN